MVQQKKNLVFVHVEMIKMICVSCKLNSDLVDKKSATWLMKKDEDGNWHWKECHRVGGKVNANIPIYKGRNKR